MAETSTYATVSLSIVTSPYLTSPYLRLNQRKEDHLSSLNWLKEKAICSNFPLDSGS